MKKDKDNAMLLYDLFRAVNEVLTTYLNYLGFWTGVASFALSIVNGKKTAKMQPLKKSKKKHF